MLPALHATRAGVARCCARCRGVPQALRSCWSSPRAAPVPATMTSYLSTVLEVYPITPGSPVVGNLAADMSIHELMLSFGSALNF